MSEMKTTAPRIAIPVPHSGDREYAERSLPQYEEAVRGAGGEPVRIELDQTPVQVMKQIERCDAVLLPGSGADIDPRKYSADRHEKTASADAIREQVDSLLLQDAYNLHKPVLGICYGLQSLNVWTPRATGCEWWRVPLKTESSKLWKEPPPDILCWQCSGIRSGV